MASLAEQAYGITRRMIIKGQLAPGRKISEPEISIEIGMSTAAVRTGLTRLSQEGLIQAIPRKGYRISPLTIDGMREIMDIRMALEPRAAFLAAGRMKADDLRSMRKRFMAGYRIGDNPSINAALALNSEFRKAIAQASGNKRLAVLIGGLVDEMERYLRLSWETENRSRFLLGGFDDLMPLLVRGAAEEALAVSQQQMALTTRQVLEALMQRREITGTALVIGSQPATVSGTLLR